MPQLGGYPVYPGGKSTMTPWYTYYTSVKESEITFTDQVVDTTYKNLTRILNGSWISEDKEDKPMTKYYRVLQDTPDFNTGAILYKYSTDYYKANENSLYLTDAAEEALDAGHNCIVRPEVVENSPLWFERVYQIPGKDQAVYGTKAEAQAAQTAVTTPASTSA